MTNKITGVMIDSREPEWVQRLTFGDVPVMVTTLEYGDLWAVTDDGCTLCVERKTPDDFLNTLKDERLFPQVAKMVEKRVDAQLGPDNRFTFFPYLVITGQFLVGENGKIITENRVTNWTYQSIQGALLTIQEMGCFTLQLHNELDYAAAIVRLGERGRSATFNILPPRVPNVVGPQVAILATIPGLGLGRAWQLYKDFNQNLAWALEWLTDPQAGGKVEGIGNGIRTNTKALFGLSDGMAIKIVDEKEKSNGRDSETRNED